MLNELGESPDPEPGSVFWFRIRRHPTRHEAVTLDYHPSAEARPAKVLGRWDLGPPVRLLQTVRTGYSGVGVFAVSRLGDEIAVAPSDGPIHFRAWDDLRIRRRIAEHLTASHTVALSPDGAWIATANSHEKIYFIRTATGIVVNTCSGAERNSFSAFDPTSSLFAASCSWQGSSSLNIERLNRESDRWHRVARFERDSDELGACVFSPDSLQVAWFETDTAPVAPTGWRGNLCLGDVATACEREEFDDDEALEPRWCVSIDARMTGDRRSLDEAGHGRGFHTEVVFAGPNLVAFGSTLGQVLFFHVSDGLHAAVATGDSADVLSLDVDASGGQVLVLSRDDPQWIPVP